MWWLLGVAASKAFAPPEPESADRNHPDEPSASICGGASRPSRRIKIRTSPITALLPHWEAGWVFRQALRDNRCNEVKWWLSRDYDLHVKAIAAIAPPSPNPMALPILLALCGSDNAPSAEAILSLA